MPEIEPNPLVTENNIREEARQDYLRPRPTRLPTCEYPCMGGLCGKIAESRGKTTGSPYCREHAMLITRNVTEDLIALSEATVEKARENHLRPPPHVYTFPFRPNLSKGKKKAQKPDFERDIISELDRIRKLASEEDDKPSWAEIGRLTEHNQLMKSWLEWLDSRGGLGNSVHEDLRRVIKYKPIL